MKRLITLILCLSLMLTFTCVFASAATNNTGSLSLSGTPRAGETFTVTFTAAGVVGGYSGSFSYDNSQLTLVSATNAGGSHWTSFTCVGNNVYATRDSGTTNTVSFRATFRVNKGVATGAIKPITFSGTISSSQAAGDENGFTATLPITVEAPASTDCTLASLKVSNATLSPAFSANTTSYSCGTVGFDIAKLGVTATAAGQGAKVTVNGANLAVGENTVSIVVTAASGDKKTYTITVEREQDPDYVASNDTKLAGIEISSGTLSPAFNVALKEYVVYVPYEVTTFTLKGTAASELSKGVEGVEDAALSIGTNELVLKVTAEDDTVAEYKIYVVRMDEFGGVDTVGVPASLIDVEPEEEEEKDTAPATTSGLTLDYWVVAVGVVAALLVGFLIGMLIFKKNTKQYDDYYEDEESDDSYIEDHDYEAAAIKAKENAMADDYLASNSSDDIDMKLDDEPSIDEYIDIDSGSDPDEDFDNEKTSIEDYALPSIDKYIPKEKENVVVQSKPSTSDVTFADLTGETKPPKKKDDSHVHYMAYEEYIDSLKNDK